MTVHGELVTFGWASFSSLEASLPKYCLKFVCRSLEKLPDSDIARDNLV